MQTDVGTSVTPYRIKIWERTIFSKLVVYPLLFAQLECHPVLADTDPQGQMGFRGRHRDELDKSAGVALQIGTR